MYLLLTFFSLIGILLSTPETVGTCLQLLRLWVHEVHRVYCDRLNEDKDVALLKVCLLETVRKCFDRQSAAASDDGPMLAGVDENTILQTPLLFCHMITNGVSGHVYEEVEDYCKLQDRLEKALDNYNESYPRMDLVLFEDAVSHVCRFVLLEYTFFSPKMVIYYYYSLLFVTLNRISRALELPSGHVLLVGVGGSGKQSLARLAATIRGFHVVQLQNRPGFTSSDIKSEFVTVCMKAGLKKMPMVFLVTDALLVDEAFFCPIHDFLAAGEILGLLTDEEIDDVISNVRNEVTFRFYKEIYKKINFYL